MSKYLFFFTIYCIGISGISEAQHSITPVTTSAYCPIVPINFTITISGIPDKANAINAIVNGYVVPGVTNCISANIAAAPNVTVTNKIGYFTFTGSFWDSNSPQGLELSYQDSLGNLYTASFSYGEIESFSNPSSTSTPSPNLKLISAPLCQTQTFPVSFADVKYYDGYLGLTYGNVTGYQYLIPKNWKLGNSTEPDGNTWINGSNSVTITSDLTDGDGSSVEIRAVNVCGTGLVYGPIASIPITRTTPLTITSSNGSFLLCSGSNVFTLNNAPAGSTITWSISNSSIATITPSPPSVTVTKAGATSGVVTLTANVTSCAGPMNPISVKISVGPPQNMVMTNLNNLNDCSYGTLALLASPKGSQTTYNGALTVSDGVGVSTSYLWSYAVQPQGPPAITYYDNGGGVVTLQSKLLTNYVLSMKCSESNSCGNYAGYYDFVIPSCSIVQRMASISNDSTIDNNISNDSTIDNNIKVYPNPSNNMIYVNLPTNINLDKSYIKITDLAGGLIKRINSSSYTNKVNIQNLAAGVYIVEIYSNQKLIGVRKIIKN